MKVVFLTNEAEVVNSRVGETVKRGYFTPHPITLLNKTHLDGKVLEGLNILLQIISKIKMKRVNKKSVCERFMSIFARS